MNPLRLFSVALAGVVLLAAPIRAQEQIDTGASHAVLLDFKTGAVLFEKNADVRMTPSSMSKLMTMHVLFERLKEGRLSLEDSFGVSERAWRMGGSKMFVAVNSRVKVEDLVRGIVVQSGNDACVVVAEGLAGSEPAFAEILNRKAAEIGLKGSHFVNASGWPDPNHYMTARDLATLARKTVETFPEYYHYYAEKEFTYNGIKQGNRNPLLYKDLGVDGLKTGHTEGAGYGLTASALRNGRRLILVVNGLPNVNARSREAERLLDWGYREFDNYALFKAGEEVGKAEIWLGTAPTVPLVIGNEMVITLPRKVRREMKVTVTYDGPVAAPITRGARVATLTISAPGRPDLQVPLVAGDEVPRLGLMGRLTAALKYILWGKSG
jgi:D-alanyl-D-alanine carboxypeptidase (penicillin-binding protein 5/6)